MDEDEDEVSLSRLCLSSESDIGAGGEDGDYFPFLALSDELIAKVFSFLSMEDRLRLRVNKRLNKIELESKYFLNRLCILEFPETSFRNCPYTVMRMGSMRCFYFVEEWSSYSSDFFRRISQNVSIGSLKVALTGWQEYHREVYTIIKDFDIGSLQLTFGNFYLEHQMMVDSFFLDLTRACKELDLTDKFMETRCDKVTPGAFHQVYNVMLDGSTKLRKITVRMEKNQCISLLSLIGITYRDGQFFANRIMEAITRQWSYEYADSPLEWRKTHIFDGNLEIYLNHEIFSYELGKFSFELHETEESLDTAKNLTGFLKINVSPNNE